VLDSLGLEGLAECVSGAHSLPPVVRRKGVADAATDLRRGRYAAAYKCNNRFRACPAACQA
jgi:hypothetical protein